MRQRIPYAAECIGIAVKANEMMVKYPKVQETFGAPLSERQGIQWMLVENEIDIRAIKWLAFDASCKAARGGVSLAFGMRNSNKRGMAMKLKTAAGRVLLIELAKGADILLENVVPGGGRFFRRRPSLLRHPHRPLRTGANRHGAHCKDCRRWIASIKRTGYRAGS